jgi:nicotinate-nucleotide--dimethylbenzimidazole phosphoribosyltransferase
MVASPDFSAEQRDAVYRAIFERRDVRSYLPDPVPDEVLERLLLAAHHAPSVGFMQPWNFVVLRSPEIRRGVHAHFLEVNARAAQVWKDDQRHAYQALKLQGILDAPVSLLVTCDPARGGEHVLGRFTMPETDLYSTCLAVQNLWLAARAEGLGVGWMSIMEKDAMRALLGIPEAIVPVAFLTLGYPVAFARAPMLSEVGWRKRLPLAELVYEDRWGAASQLGRASAEAAALQAVVAPAMRAAAPLSAPEAALQRNRDLTKPFGSLGVLEELSLRLAGLQQTAYPRCDAAHLTLFAGDHGVTAQRVSAFKRETTLKMVYGYLAGNAVVNAFAREQRVQLHVVDVGVDHDFGAAAGLIHKKVRRGTRDFTLEPAMTAAECDAAREAGEQVVRALPELQVLLLGEMGIGNSTSAAALAAGLLGLAPEAAAGPGTGVGAAGRARKVQAIEHALALHPARGPDALLCNVGGFEIAALVGAIEAAAERRALVLLDGFITGVAALIALRRTPHLSPFLVASHLSAEPAHAAVLAALGQRPLLALDMRLGEGSGAALAMGLVRAACRVMREVRTFEEANIERPEL